MAERDSAATGAPVKKTSRVRRKNIPGIEATLAEIKTWELTPDELADISGDLAAHATCTLHCKECPEIIECFLVRHAALWSLITKWRKEAKADARHGVKHALDSNREHFGGVNHALAKAECADELESALSIELNGGDVCECGHVMAAHNYDTQGNRAPGCSVGGCQCIERRKIAPDALSASGVSSSPLEEKEP